MSIQLLHLFSEQVNYTRWSRFIKEHTVSTEVWTLVKDLGSWYKEHGDVEWGDFEDWFKLVKHPTMTPTKMGLFTVIFSSLKEWDDEVDSDIVNKFVTQDFCTQIAEVSLKGAEGEEIDVQDIDDLVRECGEQLDNASNLSKYVVNDSLEDILEGHAGGGLDWRLDFLNHSIGRLRAGMLVVLAARPNAGKTTMLAAEATHMAAQLPPEKCVLWINNEEAGSEVKFRVIQAALQAHEKDMRKHPVAARTKYESKVGGTINDRIVIIDKATATTSDVEEYLRIYDVGLIVVDQLWKVGGYEKRTSNDTARLQLIFQWAREVCKEHAPMITVHQLKTEADGMEKPKQSHLYMSGTVIQGEADVIMMLGNSYDPSLPQDQRCLSIVKQKGAYGPAVDPALREGDCFLTIIPERAYFQE